MTYSTFPYCEFVMISRIYDLSYFLQGSKTPIQSKGIRRNFSVFVLLVIKSSSSNFKLIINNLPNPKFTEQYKLFIFPS